MISSFICDIKMMKAEKLLRREKIEMEVNEEKRKKFMEYAGKRVNNVLHDMQILEPMARSNAYDITKEDVEEMFNRFPDESSGLLLI